jgi:hypothetical protein
MVHDHESRAGGIAQPQQTLAQRGHGARIVVILTRARNRAWSTMITSAAGSPRGGNGETHAIGASR